MLKKIAISILTVFFLSVLGFAAAADNNNPICTQLKNKVSGDNVKYSLDADVDGPVFFGDIGCGVKYRSKELCAMEMISFDTSAKVYDYYTSEKIDIGQAYFCLDEENPNTPIPAFSSKESAEKYIAERKNGVLLDYDGLTERMIK